MIRFSCFLCVIFVFPIVDKYSVFLRYYARGVVCLPPRTEVTLKVMAAWLAP